MGVALHERVDKRQQRTAEGEIQSQRVGEQNHHQEGNQAQAGEQRHRFPGFDPAGGQGAILGAFDVLVPVPVGEIVDGAAGRTHEEDAQGEHNNVAKPGATITGQPERPVGWPQQE